MTGGLAMIGVVLIVIGGLLILWSAFKESFLWGLGCIVIPLVALYFVATHWSETKGGFLIQLLGWAIFLVSVMLAPQEPVEESRVMLLRMLWA